MGKHFHTKEALFPRDMDYYVFICAGCRFYVYEDTGFKGKIAPLDLVEVAS